MLRIHIANRARRIWYQRNSTFTTGDAFLRDSLLEGPRLTERFSEQTTFDTFRNLLTSLNGFFAAIHQTDGQTYLAVDPLRSIPIFYSLGRDSYVSDDPHWIRGEVGEQDSDPEAATEFLYTGYVTGSSTLSPQIKQVQAGEVVAIHNSDGDQVASARYIDLQIDQRGKESIDGLVQQSYGPLTAAFSRLIRFANGRTIVVPLSGGLDSRLVLLMLKRLGYDRLVALSYGRRSNREAAVSREISSALNVPWHFIEYSNETWRNWCRGGEWNDFFDFASGLVSAPNIQDWPAVGELKKNHHIPDDSIFVPGHLAWHGTIHPPYIWLQKERVSAEELTSEIFEEFYDLRTFQHVDPELRNLMAKRIRRLAVPTAPTGTSVDAAISFETFWWREYAAKFLVNSVRAYEFWGYRWWLPLWDMDLVRFWSKVPIGYRYGKPCNRLCVQRLETMITHRPPIKNTSPTKPNSRLGLFLRRTNLLRAALKMRSIIDYDTHPYAWYSIIPRSKYYNEFLGIENINSYVTAQTLKQFFPKWSTPRGKLETKENSLIPSSVDK